MRSSNDDSSEHRRVLTEAARRRAVRLEWSRLVGRSRCRFCTMTAMKDPVARFFRQGRKQKRQKQ